jgi:hypothetical protein
VVVLMGCECDAAYDVVFKCCGGGEELVVGAWVGWIMLESLGTVTTGWEGRPNAG